MKNDREGVGSWALTTPIRWARGSGDTHTDVKPKIARAGIGSVAYRLQESRPAPYLFFLEREK
jgi:hypothetical protein